MVFRAAAIQRIAQDGYDFDRRRKMVRQSAEIRVAADQEISRGRLAIDMPQCVAKTPRIVMGHQISRLAAPKPEVLQPGKPAIEFQRMRHVKTLSARQGSRECASQAAGTGFRNAKA